MSPANLAAVLPAPKAQLQVQKVECYEPGESEILVRNEVIAFNPIEAKMAILDIMPLEYPTILGSTFGGTVEAIGPGITDVQHGERVVVSNKFGVVSNQYAAYQRYCLVRDALVIKVPGDVDLSIPASLTMNLTCVVELFSGRLGLRRPHDAAEAQEKSPNILVYGGSSSFGSIAVQYLSHAGYQVVTTSSGPHRDFVSSLGAGVVVDHGLEPAQLQDELIAQGPYDVVVDTISLPETVDIVAKVLVAQGGGKFYTTQPAFGEEDLPDGVDRVFERWSDPLYESRNDDLRDWLVREYFPQASQGEIRPVPITKVGAGLSGINQALKRMLGGVSGEKLVANPWE